MLLWLLQQNKPSAEPATDDDVTGAAFISQIGVLLNGTFAILCALLLFTLIVLQIIWIWRGKLSFLNYLRAIFKTKTNAIALFLILSVTNELIYQLVSMVIGLSFSASAESVRALSVVSIFTYRAARFLLVPMLLFWLFDRLLENTISKQSLGALKALRILVIALIVGNTFLSLAENVAQTVNIYLPFNNLYYYYFSDLGFIWLLIFDACIQVCFIVLITIVSIRRRQLTASNIHEEVAMAIEKPGYAQQQKNAFIFLVAVLVLLTLFEITYVIYIILEDFRVFLKIIMLFTSGKTVALVHFIVKNVLEAMLMAGCYLGLFVALTWYVASVNRIVGETGFLTNYEELDVNIEQVEVEMNEESKDDDTDEPSHRE